MEHINILALPFLKSFFFLHTFTFAKPKWEGEDCQKPLTNFVKLSSWMFERFLDLPLTTSPLHTYTHAYTHTH